MTEATLQTTGRGTYSTGGSFAYAYDASNRLTSVNGQTYTWDNNGNLLNDGSALYRYDQANPVKSGQGHGRLISTTLGSVTSLYNYNGDGARLRQVVGGTPTTYTQDMAAPLPVVLQAQTGSATTQYLYSLGTRPIGQYADAWEYLLPDARPCPTLHWSVGGPLGVGSVRQIVDASGNVILAESYEPYGTVLTSTGTASSIFGYAGEQFDTYIKLVFLRSRYYDPGTGRFLTKDSWQGDYTRPQSLDTWSYVEGNPINHVDPNGQQCGTCGDETPPPPPDCVPSPPFGYCVDENSIVSTFEATILRPTVKQNARQFGIPWQILGGVLESERKIDWDFNNMLRELAIWYSLSVFGKSDPAISVTKNPSNPASGYGNIHVPTARSAADYFASEYLLCVKMQLDISKGDSDAVVVTKLQNFDFNIRTAAAVVRQLADYRFGSDRNPLKIDHSNLADWMLTDAVALWHGYRFGVPGVSPPNMGLGFRRLEDFQDRTKTLPELINTVIIGNGNPKVSAAQSIPIFQKFFEMP